MRKHMRRGVGLPLRLFVISICFTAAAITSLTAYEPLTIGTDPQLFADDYLIDSSRHLRRVAHQATKANDGNPIFRDGRLYGTVLYDDGKFKMWWRHQDQSGYSYAESVDGLDFETKAELSGINFAGDYTLAVEIDENAPDKNARFIAGYDAPGMAAGIAKSADGISWIPLNNGKPVTHRAADTYNQIVWDEAADNYKLFTRTDFGTGGGTGEVRGHRVMTNPNIHEDPTNWELVKEWIFHIHGESEKQRRQIYALTDWIYHGQHFALMTVYEYIDDFSEGPQDKLKRHDKDVMNIYLGRSRDGASWDLSSVYAEQPLIERGGDGAFDNGIAIAASRIVTHENKHWIYYSGWNERHGNPDEPRERDAAIGLATLRLEGFYSLHAKDRKGTMTTRAFVLGGNELEINVDASEGELTAEILNERGKAIPEFSGENAATLVNADGVRETLKWPKALAGLNGSVIKLKLTMKNSHVYAMKVSKP